MTDLLTRDPNDSGEIPAAETLVVLHPQPYLSVVDTERIDVGEGTRNLAPYMGLPPALRRPDVTGEIPVYEPATIGVVDFTPKPSGPSTPPPPQPKPGPPRSWNGPAGHWQIITPEPDPVRPDRWRGRHRREAPLWASLLLHLGADMVGCAIGTAAVLLWAVTR